MLCKESRLDAEAAGALAKRHLQPDLGSDADARQPEHRGYLSAAQWVSRADFYRSLKDRVPLKRGVEVRSAIQQIALDIGGVMAIAE